MKRLLGCLLLLVGLGAADAHAFNSSISCPASVKAGTPLYVQLNVVNWNYYPVTVKAADVFVVGNSAQNTLFGANFWGPFRKTGFGPIDLPAYDGFGYPAGSVFNVMVMDSVPASLAGKTAIVTTILNDSNNNSLSDNGCNTLVTN